MRSKVVMNLTLSSILVINQFFSYPVLADEYTVSGNGEGSSNSVNVNQNNSTNVEQKNEAEVKNEVKAESNTGNNEVSDNKGEASVETGDSSSEVVVENSLNHNQASSGCCPSGGSSASISGNGNDSSNQISNNQTANNSIKQSNGATINNNIQVNANTGNNEASGNTGNTTIKTGKVNIEVGVSNKTNTSYAAVSKPSEEVNLKISGNGEGSTNLISNDIYSNDEFFSDNYLTLNNNIDIYANTGGNKARDNKGKVLISTGNVYLDIILSNKGNFNFIKAACGCEEHTPSPTPSGSPKPSESPSSSTPSSGGGGSNGGSSGGSGGSGGSSGSGSSGGGQVLGVTLPATGGFSLIQASFFALSLLFSGIILKLDIKLPGRKYVKKLKRDIIFDYFYEFKKVVGELINFKLPYPVPRYIFAYY